MNKIITALCCAILSFTVFSSETLAAGVTWPVTEGKLYSHELLGGDHSGRIYAINSSDGSQRVLSDSTC